MLVVIDTLRADWTSAYGFSEETTPELARWAARGALFEDVVAQSSWTKISMASMMTSLWPRSHGIREARDGLADSALTLAEILRSHGYATYGIQTNGWLHESFGFGQGFDRYVFPRGGSPRRFERPAIWPHADRVLDEATRALDALDPRQPIFLYLHFMDVHEYAAPPEYHRFGTDARGAYLAAVRWIDDGLAQLRRELRARSLLDHTLLVLASDHGETFGEHGVWGHARDVLSAVLHVPLVFRFPFETPGTRVPTRVRLIDLGPTLLDLLQIPRPTSFEGRSLRPLLARSPGADPARRSDDRIAFAGLGARLFRDARVQVSLRDGPWTYARNLEKDGAGAEFLFDRLVDPAETVNLTNIEGEPAARLRRQMDEHLAGKTADVLARQVRIDPGIAARLRSLGYLGGSETAN